MGRGPTIMRCTVGRAARFARATVVATRYGSVLNKGCEEPLEHSFLAIGVGFQKAL
jgi:hypothetical protein